MTKPVMMVEIKRALNGGRARCEVAVVGTVGGFCTPEMAAFVDGPEEAAEFVAEAPTMAVAESGARAMAAMAFPGVDFEEGH